MPAMVGDKWLSVCTKEGQEANRRDHELGRQYAHVASLIDNVSDVVSETHFQIQRVSGRNIVTYALLDTSIALIQLSNRFSDTAASYTRTICLNLD